MLLKVFCLYAIFLITGTVPGAPSSGNGATGGSLKDPKRHP